MIPALVAALPAKETILPKLYVFCNASTVEDLPIRDSPTINVSK